MNAAALLGRLRSVQWDWRASEAERMIEAIGGAEVRRVPGRIACRLEGAEDLSLYVEGDETLVVEITLESYRDPHQLSPDDYEDKVDEYFRKYQATVAEAVRVFGRPIFDDGLGASGFPEDQEATWLALWAVSNARLMIQQKHEDKELPLRLCIVVAPS